MNLVFSLIKSNLFIAGETEKARLHLVCQWYYLQEERGEELSLHHLLNSYFVHFKIFISSE